MHTFVIRSKDRVAGVSNDFRVQLPFLPDLARNEYWCVSVQRCVFPKANGHTVWYDTTAQQLIEPASTVITGDFVEVHVDFGGTAKGHDTSLRGGRFVHVVTGHVVNSTALFESGLNEAVEYEIARPNLSELRVQVKNFNGDPLRIMELDRFPNYTASTSLTNDESTLPDWFMILKVYAKNMY